MSSILDQTIDFLKKHHRDQIEQLTIADVRIGLFMSAVRLSDGSCGVASTVYDDYGVMTRGKRDFGDYTPRQIRGRTVMHLLESDKPMRVLDTLRIAALNAISSSRLAQGQYEVLEDVDPFDLLDLSTPKTVVMVGGFQSYMKQLAGTEHRLMVLEKNEKAFREEQKQYFVPATEYPTVLPQADIVVITGFSLVNRTFDQLLAAVSPKAQVLVIGPSSSLLPDVLFENGVDLIGSTRITDPEALFEVVAEGGTGFHLFKYCAQKICLRKNG
jgi:uncharacterized protein (DUF4213/DUF364 family)